MILPPFAGVTVAGVPGTMPEPKSSGTIPLSVTADCTLAVTPIGADDVWAPSDGAAMSSVARAMNRFTKGVQVQESRWSVERARLHSANLHRKDNRPRQRLQNFRSCLEAVRKHDIKFILRS